MPTISNSSTVDLPSTTGLVAPPTVGNSAESFTGARSRARTVLIVDDDSGFRRTAAIMLEFHGFRALVACNGLEAINLLQENPHVSAILLDLLMPVMDGEEAFQHIRSFWNDIPIIMTSGFELGNAGLRLGDRLPEAVLQKPFGFSELAETLALVLK